METTTDILNELKLISPLVAGLKKVNVFTVPEGYFDTIDKTVLACLQENNSLIDLNTPGESNDVPAGYFDLLATSILEKIKTGETADDEIRHLSPLLADIQHKNVFEVPKGYFNTLDSQITQKVQNHSSADEIKALSPLLSEVRNRPTFEVPVGYFNGLSDDILKKLQPQAKVVSMQRGSRFIKYAVAAMMTGVIALGIYKYFDQPGSTVSGDAAVATLDSSIEKGKNMNDQQFNDALANLTDADIAKYLEKNGDITDVATLTNNLDESILPSQDDYLLDEATLENYLKKINKTTLNN